MTSLPRVRKPRPTGVVAAIIAGLAERIPVHPDPGDHVEFRIGAIGGILGRSAPD
jgi:hypothetical protein